MERFDYTPPVQLEVPEIEGLRIHELSVDDISEIRQMNTTIFHEERVINSFDKEDLMILQAELDGKPVGFKIGYRENRFTFYSAKGGIMPGFRRQGIALVLLDEMMRKVRQRGYRRFAFDTFPNLHPGMTILALEHGFTLVKSDYNTVYREYRLRFEMKLSEGAE